MSWGTELWDQYENIAQHTQKGLEFCERYAHFIKERCVIEIEYAAKLKKLMKSYQPKKKEEEDYEFTYSQGFLSMLKEIHDIASQHEVIAENLTSMVVKEIHSLVLELKQERKKHLTDATKQQTSLQMSLAHLEKTKNKYEKAFRDMEKAQDAYKKADADINLSRAEVEKCKILSLSKTQQCEDCKNEYASQLQKTNNCQREHYEQLMPNLYQNLQDMDEKRIAKIQEFLKSTSDTERNVIPIINTCLDGIVKAAESINPKEDSRRFIDKYKSGFEPPAEQPFEDLSNASYSVPQNSHTPPTRRAEINTVKGTVSGGKDKKKRGGLFAIFGGSKTDDSKEDFSHLPPNQQKKRLNEKIDNLKLKQAKETAERDGMVKMRDVYIQNPALGDPSTLDKQLEENAQKLDKLQQDIQKYQKYLSEVDNKGTPVRSRNSVSDDSMSRSTSDVSVTSPQTQISNPSTPVMQHYSQVQDTPSPENKGNKHDSFADQDSFDDGLEVEDLPIIGSCRAMYEFAAQNEGSIPMSEAEEFSVIELDQGDGWTRVRRSNGEEGFVPSSYIEFL